MEIISFQYFAFYENVKIVQMNGNLFEDSQFIIVILFDF
jgi:hypothetical protein